MDDFQRMTFLEEMDKADIEVNSFELQFIKGNLARGHFSDKQRVVIDKMIERYGAEIGFDPEEHELPF